mmetsp:Transcript_41809/g.75294  ORF Transcript_41809/g.75294 Transcript_41809/m.75294 type:complete len:214 (-) Transcript_41809:220-861(-)
MTTSNVTYGKQTKASPTFTTTLPWDTYSHKQAGPTKSASRPISSWSTPTRASNGIRIIRMVLSPRRRGSDFGSPWTKLPLPTVPPCTSRRRIATRLWTPMPCSWTSRPRVLRTTRKSCWSSGLCRGICSSGIRGRFTRLMDRVMGFGRRIVGCWEVQWPRRGLLTTTSVVPAASFLIWEGMDWKMGLSCRHPSFQLFTRDLRGRRRRIVMLGA